MPVYENHKYKVMLVDDDALFLFLTCQSLKNYDKLDELVTMENAQDAVEYLANTEHEAKFPEFIFIDLNMPESGGLEFARYFHRHFASSHSFTRIYILTSSLTEQNKETLKNIPAISGLLQKPLTKEKIYDIFEQA